MDRVSLPNKLEAVAEANRRVGTLAVAALLLWSLGYIRWAAPGTRVPAACCLYQPPRHLARLFILPETRRIGVGILHVSLDCK